MSLKIIDRNLRSLSTSGAAINALIHTTGMLILSHAAEHGDCTRAVTLYNAMPASMRRGMLKAWIERNSPIRIVLEKGVATKVGMLKADSKQFTPFNLAAADATPFSVEQDKAHKVFGTAEFDAGFASFIKRTEAQLKDGNVPEGERAGLEARLAVIKSLIVTNEATKASTSFVLPAANSNPRERAAA